MANWMKRNAEDADFGGFARIFGLDVMAMNWGLDFSLYDDSWDEEKR